jgi:hypothetical protein
LKQKTAEALENQNLDLRADEAAVLKFLQERLEKKAG